MVVLIVLVSSGMYIFTTCIVGETVENRVREVLEEKLSVILKEMGVDKYSDVLDSESGRMRLHRCVYALHWSCFTGREESVYPVEAEMKQQLTNAQKYKDVIREEKRLDKNLSERSRISM